jgi:hypothetical protein
MLLDFSGSVFYDNLPGEIHMIRFPKRPWFGVDPPKARAQNASSVKDVSAEESGNLRVVHPYEPVEVQPTVAWAVIAWVLALGFAWGLHSLFAILPPYAHEIVKNLKGFPEEWADLLLRGVEKFLVFAAILSALVHTLWRSTTSYGLTDREILVKTWFPIRRVEMIPLGSVKRAGFSQGLLGYVMDYGHVEIDLGGANGFVVLRNCPKPEAFLKELQKRAFGRP